MKERSGEHGGSRQRLLVLGMGNEILTDDAVGLVALARVQEELGTAADDADVTFKALNTGGLDLLYEVEGYDTLVVIDAYHASDSVPGRCRVLSAADLGPASARIDSAHLLSLPSALLLSVELGYHTPELLGIVVIDVDDRCQLFGTTLSEPVEKAVPEAVAAAIELIEKNLQLTSPIDTRPSGVHRES